MADPVDLDELSEAEKIKAHRAAGASQESADLIAQVTREGGCVLLQEDEQESS